MMQHTQAQSQARSEISTQAVTPRPTHTTLAPLNHTPEAAHNLAISQQNSMIHGTFAGAQFHGPVNITFAGPPNMGSN